HCRCLLDHALHQSSLTPYRQTKDVAFRAEANNKSAKTKCVTHCSTGCAPSRLPFLRHTFSDDNCTICSCIWLQPARKRSHFFVPKKGLSSVQWWIKPVDKFVCKHTINQTGQLAIRSRG